MIQLPGLPPPLYWSLRLARKFTPRFAINWMLDNEVILRPGQDTHDPAGAADLYADAAARHGVSIDGRSILIMGFGGGYGVALELLERGASHVALQDPFAPMRAKRNDQLSPERMSRHFQRAENGEWQPDPERVSLVREQLPDYATRNEGRFDMVLSNSVLEHVEAEEVSAHIRASARLCRPGGISIHHIDLRDHVFRYPFEMLCYRERTWRRWLNADNNLNRIRLPEFEGQFREFFSEVSLTPRLSLPDAFRATRSRIRDEFLSGNDEVDCIGAVVAVGLR